MFEELNARLDTLEKNISVLLELHLQQSNNLRTSKDVAKFLGKSTRTIRNYIKENKLIENQHYYRESNGRLVFIPEAVVEFKNRPAVTISSDKELNNATKIMHPVVEKLLQGVA